MCVSKARLTVYFEPLALFPFCLRAAPRQCAASGLKTEIFYKKNARFLFTFPPGPGIIKKPGNDAGPLRHF